VSRVEYAGGNDSLHGPNPLTARGTFPQHWGEKPDSPSALRSWIAANALSDGARSGNPDSVRILLEQRRKDPSAVREEARTIAADRMRRHRLLQLRRECP
jgi:hypothetical protein